MLALRLFSKGAAGPRLANNLPHTCKRNSKVERRQRRMQIMCIEEVNSRQGYRDR